jgi:hypothetical protein
MVQVMTDDNDRHAGKAPDERHPVQEGAAPDPSDHADLRVAQPGDDPPGEDALPDPDSASAGRAR